ncbi:mitochondrial import receptor subunit TOM70-like isoform X1 [Lytechinus pictus]|uniref:mitochondrial import receptor subunit TOM70-like isoform X1 n=1 Tax=Lytechinus pictus TaxID=7653 RepID=UPI00240E54C2|nr:mitochondrial import receptor subunit TOM70-like [Lytechinus pictus]
MAASSRPGSDVGWTKWQIAIAVGAPIAVAGLAFGAYYLTRSGSPEESSDTKSGTAGTSGNTKANGEGDAGKNSSVEHTQTPEEQAQAAKLRGNKYFKAGHYEQAIKLYSQAIEICPKDNVKDLSTFYQNKAAANEQMKNHAQVVADCNNALELNSRYVKALFRRAKAFEMMNERMKCLEDATAVCLLEGFSHQQGMILADKMLKEIGKEKAAEKYTERVPSLPSGQFIRSYFSSFSNDGISNTSDEDYCSPDDFASAGYAKAKHCFKEGNYETIIDACTEEIDSEGSKLPEALLMRATFYLLKGQGTLARPDLDKVITLPEADKKLKANALIKRGSMHMQEGQQMEAMTDFGQAATIDPDNADVYHHRGQLLLLLERVDKAVEDFQKCSSLSPDFALAHAQHCYANYRLSVMVQSPMQMQAAVKALEECCKKFSQCAEAYALYAQSLNDQGQFQQADENFLKAVALEPDNPTAYVHRGLLYLAWKKDPEQAIRMIQKALEIDSRCDFAYETLGTIEVQRGNMAAAQEYFNQAIELTRTEMEMAHLFSLSVAAQAQSNVTTKFGIVPPSALRP